MAKVKNNMNAEGTNLPAKTSKQLSPSRDIRELAKSLIYTIRGQRVILDADVADFYGRTTSSVNQQRSRNQTRFPDTYAFQLTKQEWDDLKSQFVISRSHGGRRTIPWAYTEHGFAMLSTRLRGKNAAYLSQVIIDTFVSYRRGTLPQERTLAGQVGKSHRATIQSAIYKQMERLLMMDLPTGETVSTELKSITTSAINRVKAVLDAPAVKNERISAEIKKLEAETAKIYAEVQKTNAESASIWADVYKKRLEIIIQLREMATQLERDEMLTLLDDSFGKP